MRTPRETSGDVLVFDADDTLWMTEWMYSQSYATYFAYLYEILGDRMPSLHLVRDRFFEVENGLFDRWGVKRGRVAEAMVLTYEKVCDWIEVRFGEDLRKPHHEKRIREIGDMPFDFTKLRYVPDVPDILDELAAKKARLCLLTSYDTEVFGPKADHLDVHSFFMPQHIRVIEGKKTPQDFIEVSGWAHDSAREEKDWYVVGNGESDIKPALQIGEKWQGIYIPHGSTSAYFNHDNPAELFTPPPIEHPRVKTIRHFGEIRSALNLRSPC